MNTILSKGYLLILLISITDARPVYVASLESDRNIYLGIEYKSIGFKVSLLPTFIGFTKDSYFKDWGSYAGAEKPYWTSITKSFDHKDYMSGVDWKFRYYIFDDFDSTHTLKGDGFNNAFGYYISKQFGYVELHAGSYMCINYETSIEKEFDNENNLLYKYYEDRVFIDASIQFGIMLRI